MPTIKTEPEQRTLPFDKAILLKNVTCVYCGTRLDEGNDSKEHVVGRRFVPPGALNKKWNLIVRACRKCNAAKADLEDEISAVSMQPDAFGVFPCNSAGYAAEARRKAFGARSRITGNRVGMSAPSLSFRLRSHSGALSYNVTGPPQVESARVMELARMHIVAFFYHATYRPSDSAGRFWRGNFVMLSEERRANWGDFRHLAFMNAVVGWEPRFLAYDPNEYFNIVLRKHPSADCWSWAMEWNKSFRIIGFCGDPNASEAVYSKFPQVPVRKIWLDDGSCVATKPDRPLRESEDRLFFWEAVERTD